MTVILAEASRGRSAIAMGVTLSRPRSAHDSLVYKVTLMTTQSSPNSFAVSYDRATKVISVAVIAGLVLIACTTQSVIAGCAGGLIILLAYAYSPRGYILSEQAITVKRLVGNVSLPRANFQEARRTSADDLSGGIRLWGSGGLFGYYGLFRSSRLGNYWAYVTNRRNTVVLIGAQTAMFSPDDVDGFLADLPVAAGGSGQEPLRTRGGTSAGVWIGAIGVAATIAMVIFALLYSPGPPRYRLAAGILTIQDRFYPTTIQATEVDIPHVSVVDIRVDRGWRPTARTKGFASAHYRSGWFRVANGQTVRLYQADAKRLVLIPRKGNGSPVLLEVSEPEKFVAELRREWVRPVGF